MPNNSYYLDSIDEKIKFLEDGLLDNIQKWEACKRDIKSEYELFCLLAALTTVRMQAKSD